MQDIERYGLITLLFLVASVTAVFLWGGGEPEGGVLPAQVADAQARTAVGGTPLESQRTTSRVPTSQGQSEESGAHRGAQRNRRNGQEAAARAEAQAQLQAQQAADAEAARLALVEERRRERERLEQLRAQAEADAAAEAEAERQRQAEALAAKQAIPGPDVQRQQPPLLREITVAEVLKSRGYRTACFGKWDLAGWPLWGGPIGYAVSARFFLRGWAEWKRRHGFKGLVRLLVMVGVLGLAGTVGCLYYYHGVIELWALLLAAPGLSLLSGFAVAGIAIKTGGALKAAHGE